MKYLALILFLTALILWSKGIAYPKDPYYDEVYYIPTVREYLNWNIAAYDFHYQNEFNKGFDWTHPPLARVFSSLGVFFLGDNPLGWRIPSLTFGLSTLGVFYWLARRLFPSQRLISLFSLAIFTFDLLPLVQSKVMMNEINLTFFTVFSVLVLTYYWQKPSFLNTVLLGLTLGAASANRWNGFLLIALICGLIIFFRLIKQRKNIFICFKDLAIISFLVIFVYLGSYFQYFILGGDLKLWWDMQQEILSFHLNLKATHDYQASWWMWPLMYRPTWYYVEYLSNGFVRNIYAMGNPFIWWSGLGGILYILYKWFRGREFPLGIINYSYFGLWLPFAFSPRVGFIHYYLPALPFLYLSLGIVLNRLWTSGKRIGRIFAIVYLLLVIAVFFYFYPLAIGGVLSKDELNQRFWLSSWK